uniref:Uncharacterized protein n=1 Tax=Balaenoptera musculus TaxID=9771 RepID=A0A8C0CJU4_BALMU
MLKVTSLGLSINSWTLEMDELRSPAKQLSHLHLKEEKIKPDANSAVFKTSTHTERTDKEKRQSCLILTQGADQKQLY